MNHRKIRFPIISLFLLLSMHAFAQQKEMPIALTPLIGDTLDTVERDYYRLLPREEAFVSALFYLNPDSTVRVLVHRKGSADTLISNYAKLTSVRRYIIDMDRIRKEADELLPSERKFTTPDGSRLYGVQVAETEDSTQIMTTSMGLVTFSKKAVPSPEPEVDSFQTEVVPDSLQRDDGVFSDPKYASTFLLPTASTLKAGKGYVMVAELQLYGIAYGVTDRLMISGGILRNPDPEGNAGDPDTREGVAEFHIGAKLRLFDLSETTHLACGAEYLSNGGLRISSPWFAYLVFSEGDEDMKFNFSVGTGYDLPSAASTSLLVGISGDLRVFGTLKLFAEAYSVRADGAMHFVVGARLFGRRFVGDFGLYLSTVDDDFGGLPKMFPAIGLSYNF